LHDRCGARCRRSIACSIAAPRFARSDTEAGFALVVFGSPASFSGETAARLAGVARCRRAALSPRRRRRRATRPVNKGKSNATSASDSISNLAQRLLGGDHRLRDCAARGSAARPHPRLQGFRHRRTDPVDNCGHGTHVAGIIAGSGARSNGLYAGIAPDVDIVALRVLGDDCSGNTSDVIDALEWIGRNHDTYNIKVVNISLGQLGARVDLHRSPGAGGGAAVAQGRGGRHRGRQQGPESRETASRVTAASACRATRRRRSASARSIPRARRI
jgi:hypothetical protein